MKKIVFLFAGIASIAFAEIVEMPTAFLADSKKAIEAARLVTAKRFPDADLVMIDDRIHTEYNSDGTETMWDDEWVKVLTEKGRREASTVTLNFSKRYGDAKILDIEIIDSNGKVRKVDFKNNMKVVTDNSSMGSNIYDPMDKKIVCSIPGLKVGEMRHIRFCKRTLKPRMKGTWADYNIFEYTYPIISSVYSVSQPNENPIKHAVLRSPYSNTVQRLKDVSLKNNRTLLKWEIKNVPQIFPEPSMPPIHTQVQRLIMSTAKDWQTVSKWYWKLCEPRLEATTPDMTNEVRKITGKLKTRNEKIRALFKFVSQEIRYMGLTDETEAPGYEPHDVKLTFHNRYGVCRDKAALLAEMLRIADIKAFPVLIHAGAKMDPDIPLPYFNHAIVAVEAEGSEKDVYGKYILMDPTNESTKDIFPAYLSDKSYLVARPEGETLLTSQVTPVKENMYTAKTRCVASPNDTMILESEMVFGGINDTLYRSGFLRRTEEERRKLFERWIERIAPGSELLTLEITPRNLSDTEEPLKAKVSARLRDMAIKGETSDELHLPFMTKVLGIADMLLDQNTSLEKRRFPIVLDVTAGWEEDLTIELGEKFGKVQKIPEMVSVGKDSEGFHFLRKICVTNGVLKAKRKLLVSDVNFSVPQYYKLRENRKECESGERANPLFKKVEDENANVRNKLIKTIVHIKSEKSRVVTNIVEKKILTYKGKKASSELKYNYNPSTKGSVKIVEAVVTNAKGEVKRLSQKEQNVMDSSWVGSAPRYPASKMLIANLPAVEIGSTIRYVVEHIITNSAVAFSFENVFGSKDNIDLEEYEIHVPSSMNVVVSGKDAKITAKADGGKCYTWSVKNPKRIPNEVKSAPKKKWIDYFGITLCSYEKFGKELLSALDDARERGSKEVIKIAREKTSTIVTAEEKIEVIRKFILQSVKGNGPELLELPFEYAFFPPDQVLKEGYASSGDRMNLFRTMLEGAGFDTSFVLSANDGNGYKENTEELLKFPVPSAFSKLVIKAKADGKTFWLSNENEYTPVNSSLDFYDTFYDLEKNEFGVIGEEEDNVKWWNPFSWNEGSDCALTRDGGKWISKKENKRIITIRENGTVDMDVIEKLYGPSVGTMRKLYAEMLPEKRLRHYQGIVGEISANATATSELEVDEKSYPFTRKYSVSIPEYAVVRDGVISIEIPSFRSSPFFMGKAERQSPIMFTRATEEVVTYEIVFPKGYETIEYLPKSFVITNPHDEKEEWIRYETSKGMVDGALKIIITKKESFNKADIFPSSYYSLFNEFHSKTTSPSVRVITVREK